MLVVGNMPRDATSTALVPPTPYNGMPVLVPQQPYSLQPQISRRTKMILAGAALSLFAAILTVAIIKGGGNSGGGGNNSAEPEQEQKQEPEQKATTTPPSKTTVQPIETPKATVVTPPKTDPSKSEVKVTPKTDSQKLEPPKTVAKVEPPKTETPKVEPPKKEPPPPPPPPKKEPPKVVAKVEPPPPPPKKEPPPKKKEPPKTVAKVVKEPPPKREPPPKKEPAKKRVASDTSGVKAKAEDLFRAKRFKDAANVLRAAASGADPDDASDLKSAAGVYEQFGAAYNVGMAPGTAAKEAYQALKKAKNFDSDGVFTSEITAKLGPIAAKAAASYVAAKNFPEARQAVAVAEANGGGGSTTQGIRQNLEQQASALVKEAQGMMSSDPDAARSKLKTVQQMVDSKSPSYQKASKLLSSG
jgi:hypothetical protein